MLSLRDLKGQDLQGLSPETVTALAAQMLERIEQQRREIDLQRRDLEVRQKLIERKDRVTRWEKCSRRSLEGNCNTRLENFEQM